EDGCFRPLISGRQRDDLPGSALPPDSLVELHPVPSLCGVPALLAADAADLAEEFLTVALFGGHTTLAPSFGAGHLDSLGLGHPIPSSVRGQQSRGARQASSDFATLRRSTANWPALRWAFVNPSWPPSRGDARVCSDRHGSPRSSWGRTSSRST